MKIRQTLTLSPEVSARARVYARRQGMSFSALVETLLRERTFKENARGESTPVPGSFSQRWHGKGKLSAKKDIRTQHLRAKYGL